MGRMGLRDGENYSGKRFWSMNRVYLSDTGYLGMISRATVWLCVREGSSRVEMEDLGLKMKL